MPSKQPPGAKPDTSPNTSKRRRSILGRAKAAFSSLSRSGVNNVPVLSPRVPSRSRPPSSQPSGGHKDNQTDVVSQARSPRPLSVASVSTFGASVPKQACAVDDSFDRRSTTCAADFHFQSPGELPLPALRPRAERPEAVEQQHACSAKAPGYVGHDLDTRTNLERHTQSVRMQPPSTVLSPAAPEHDSTTLSRTRSTVLPHEIAHNAVPERSLDSNIAGIRRHVFASLGADPFIRHFENDDVPNAGQLHSSEQAPKQPTQMAPRQVSKGFLEPQDGAYVEALRLWYEEQEITAAQARVRKHSDADETEAPERPTSSTSTQPSWAKDPRAGIRPQIRPSGG